MSITAGRELRLPCDIMFGYKPKEDIAGMDYASKLGKIGDIHQRVRSNLKSAGDWMKEAYDVKANQK